MFNQKLFNSNLSKIKEEASYQIFIKTPLNNYLLLVNHWNELSDCKYKERNKHESFLMDKQTHTILTFTYPDNFEIVVYFNGKIEIDENQRQFMYYLLYPFYTEYSLKESKYKIERIIDSIRQTTSNLNIEDAFSNILKNTLEVIPSADLGTLWVYDQSINRIVCKSSVGNIQPCIKRMKFRMDDNLIGNTFESGTPRLLTNTSEFMNSELWKCRKEENHQYWDWSYNFTNNVKSLLVAPIIVNSVVECVLVLSQIKTKTSLSEYDLEILQGFTAQMGIVIRNAKIFTNLKNQNELLLKRDEIHTTFTNLSLQNMGANKVISALTNMIKLPLVFIDLIENEIPNRTNLIPNFTHKEFYDYISAISGKSSFILDTSGEKNVYLYPIHTGNVTLGCLILEALRELNPLDQIALEQAHSVLALELVKKQNLVQFYYKNKRELFNEIINSKDLAQIYRNANELGIRIHTNLVAVIAKFTNFTELQLQDAHVHRLITQIKMEMPHDIQTIFGYNNEVTVIIDIPSNAHFHSFVEKLNKMVNDWRTPEGIFLTAGIGSVYEGAHLIERSYYEAKTALTYLISRKETGCIVYSDIGVNRLFINQSVEEINSFFMDVITPLRSPQGLNNNLEETLITFFECNRSATQTAKKMHVHINTLYLRLKKIEEILQLSFDNPENVLRLQLACYLKTSYGIIQN